MTSARRGGGGMDSSSGGMKSARRSGRGGMCSLGRVMRAESTSIVMDLR